MNKNIFKIISHLVKRLLHDDETIENEEKLVSSLQDKGYELDEINQAFEFIFASSQKIDLLEETNKEINLEQNNSRQRVFDVREKIKLSTKVRGIIIKLNKLNLITEEKLEKIITKSMATYDIVNIVDFWKMLDETINDEIKLSVIANQIDDFKYISNINLENNHIN